MTRWADPELDRVDALLVEDSADDADLIHRCLAGAGLAEHLALAPDGEAAVDLLDAHRPGGARAGHQPPRLVLLDLKLPKLSGLEVLRRIRNDPVPSLAAIPVVVTTSSSQDGDMQTAYSLGVNAYIVKPVDYAEFQRIIKQTGVFWLTVNQPLRQAPVSSLGER